MKTPLRVQRRFIIRRGNGDAMKATPLYEIRSFDGEEESIRAIDEENRSATFVVATENPVGTWRGPECLRLAGMNLRRFKKNPVVLDAHDRSESGNVIGSADVTVETGRMLATIRFADTDRAEEVWKLVKGGFIRATSIGFTCKPEDVRELGPGQKDGDFEGPCVVVRKSELYEISVVPVPADMDAVRRNFQPGESTPLPKEGIKMSDQKEERAAVAPVELPSETHLRDEKARIETIRLIMPCGCEATCERAIVEKKSVEEARALYIAALNTRCPAVGTPEPAAAAKPQTKTEARQLTQEEFLRGLRG